MSIMVATGKGATFGVLFKDAESIETLREVNTLVVDKTDRGQTAPGRDSVRRMSFSSVSVVGNALRLRSVKL